MRPRVQPETSVGSVLGTWDLFVAATANKHAHLARGSSLVPMRARLVHTPLFPIFAVTCQCRFSTRVTESYR